MASVRKALIFIFLPICWLIGLYMIIWQTQKGNELRNYEPKKEARFEMGSQFYQATPKLIDYTSGCNQGVYFDFSSLSIVQVERGDDPTTKDRFPSCFGKNISIIDALIYSSNQAKKFLSENYSIYRYEIYEAFLFCLLVVLTWYIVKTGRKMSD